MQTGWQYLGNNGTTFVHQVSIATGWYQEGSTWYYLDAQAVI